MKKREGDDDLLEDWRKGLKTKRKISMDGKKNFGKEREEKQKKNGP